MSGTPKRDLSEKKRALLELLRKEKGISPSAQVQIVARPGKGPFPVSYAQERLWFLDRFEPGGTEYNIPNVYRLGGALNLAALEQSLAEIIRRHAVLRSTFSTENGKPVQFVQEAGSFRLELTDLSSLPKEESERRAGEIAQAESETSFDLEKGPLIRARVVRLSPVDHVLAVVMHHIVSDGWSFGVMVEEISSLYSAFSEGKPSPLRELPFQYSDFAAWQRELLEGESLKGHFDYWKRVLEGAPSQLELPTDRPRPAMQTFKGSSTGFALDSALSKKLAALCKANGTTMFMTLLAAYQALLSRYSGQADVLVGTPVAGRTNLMIEGLIGFFVNTLVLRANFEGDPTFAELLRQVRETSLGAFSHQEMPFAKLVSGLKAERSLSHSPLFQAMFVLQNTPESEGGLTELEVNPLDVESESSNYDLTLSMDELSDAIVGDVEYNTDLFDPGTIDRFIRHFVKLLEAVCADPRRRISEIELVDEDDRAKALESGRGARGTVPEPRVPELIAERARLTPAAVALVAGETSITYRELDERANRVARRLRGLGVRRGSLVGVCMDRSIDLIVSLLGTWRAGAGYLPIDPDYPADRIRYMVQDSAIRVLLTRADFDTRFTGFRGLELVRVDRDPALAAEDGSALATAGDSGDAAYVIYTSGSTGKPKGVLVEHRSLSNYVANCLREYSIDSRDRVLQFSSISFDASAEEIYPCLVAGGTLVLRTELMLESPATFLEQSEKWGITVMGLPTSYWHELAGSLSEDGPELPPALRLVIIGGDRAIPERVAAWRKHARPGVRLMNTYGPTEATIVCTLCDISGWSSPGELPIGRPVLNETAYVLDARLNVVPVGLGGDLYIGGAGLARGYLNRPDLTAEKFIPDPFGGEPGARLYRTGDRARVLPDGRLQFLGRADHQVKIRGFRIELGEVEAALFGIPGMKDAIVIAREEPSGQKKLVAYVVPSDPPADSYSRELRNALRGSLPAFMIPSSFVVLEALPLSPSGKVDRRALPEPDGPSEDESVDDRSLPRNRAERILVEVWQQVLGAPSVGIHDNFFELGGDSILSIQVVARSNAAGLRINPRMMFQSQTVAELALVAETAREIRAEQEAVEGPVPLTPVQLEFFAQNLVDTHHWNQAFQFEFSERPDFAALEESVRELIRHHDALRMRFTRTPAGWTQECTATLASGPVIERVDFSALMDDALEDAIEKKANQLQSTIDLGSGLLLKAAYFDHGEGKSGYLMLVIHHLVVDGVSWRILLDDLQGAYERLSAGGPPALPPKTTSFRYWAERLSAYAASAELAEEIPYWTDPARGDALPIPLDRPDGVNRNTEASEHSYTVRLDAEKTRALLKSVPAAYGTRINEALLAAYARAYTDWAGGTCAVIDLEGHGREYLFDDIDVSRTVGWFTSVFPVTLKLPKRAEEREDPGQVIRSIKEQVRAIPRNGIGFGILRYLHPDAALRASIEALPAARICFNYLGQIDQVIQEDSAIASGGDAPGEDHSEEGNRSYLLELTAIVADGVLEANFSYSDEVHDEASVAKLAQRFLFRLEELVEHCRSGAGAYTPSDFPLAELDADTADKFFELDREIEDIYPLTPMQSGMLFHSLKDPASGVYFEQVSCVLRGKVDPVALARAWQELANRHTILRTSFHWAEAGDREPLQAVHRKVVIPVRNEDWSALGEDARGTKFQAFLDDDIREGFDMTRAPVMRIAILKFGEGEYGFVWSHHHILLDGWSQPLLLNEAFELYDVFAAGATPELEPVRPFGDYVRWISEQDPRQAEEYWRRTFAGHVPPAPIDFAPYPPAGATGFSEEDLELGEESTEALKTIARARQLTLNTLVQGAWGILLSRYTGNPDVVFGSTLSGRPGDLPGVESMIGLFINTLPVRVNPRPDAPVLDWLKAMQDSQAELRQYEYTHLIQVHGWSGVPRNRPLFESIVVFENYPVDESLEGEEKSDFEADEVEHRDMTNLPLTLAVSAEKTTSVVIGYDCSRFSKTAIRSMLGHFKTVVEAIARANPGTSISELPMMTDEERARTLKVYEGEAGPSGDVRARAYGPSGSLLVLAPVSKERAAGLEAWVSASGGSIRVADEAACWGADSVPPTAIFGSAIALARAIGAAGPVDLSKLKTIVSDGEDGAHELAKSWAGSLPAGVAIHHEYSPEGAAGPAVFGKIVKGGATRVRFAGRLAPGMKGSVVDASGAPQPVGITGGLSFDGRPTGLRARILVDGTVECFGRPRAEGDHAHEAPAAFAPPRDAVEEIMCGVFVEVLAQERVGIHDDFFELGGHSLLAIQVIARVRNALSVELPLRAVFESPTPEGLAREVRRSREAGFEVAIPIHVARREEKIPLSSEQAQQRLWFLGRPEGAEAEFTVPICLNLDSAVDVAVLQRAIGALVQRHEALRTVFPLVDGEPVQRVVAHPAILVSLVDLSAGDAATAQAAAKLRMHDELVAPWNLEAGPLFRATLFRFPARSHSLFVTIHHILADGWSADIFARELEELYDALVAGTEPNLAPLPIQYADYAIWQREWMRGRSKERQLDYWRKRLEHAPAVNELPTDRPRPEALSARGASVELLIPNPLVARLGELSRRQGVTVFMTLIAAFKALLHRFSGQTDLLVGTPVAGRGRAELEGLIGCFANSLVLRTDLAGDPTFEELLARVRETVLGAFANQELPFQTLIDELKPVRSRGFTPFFQVMFALQSSEDEIDGGESGDGDSEESGEERFAVSDGGIELVVADYDLTITLDATEEGLHAELEFATDLFDAATAGKLAAGYLKLLEAYSADPKAKLSEPALEALSALPLRLSA